MLSSTSGSLNFNIRVSVSYLGGRRSDYLTQICCFKTPDGEKTRCRGKKCKKCKNGEQDAFMVVIHPVQFSFKAHLFAFGYEF